MAAHADHRHLDPGPSVEAAWKTHGARLVTEIRNGERVLVHCKGGLGRAGTVAALMLVELGMVPEQAIRAVRDVRKGAIETPDQETFVRHYRRSRILEVSKAERGIGKTRQA